MNVGRTGLEDSIPGFIDPSLARLEKALIARAEVLKSPDGHQGVAAMVRKANRMHSGHISDVGIGIMATILSDIISEEFRNLSKELHGHG